MRKFASAADSAAGHASQTLHGGIRNTASCPPPLHARRTFLHPLLDNLPEPLFDCAALFDAGSSPPPGPPVWVVQPYAVVRSLILTFLIFDGPTVNKKPNNSPAICGATRNYVCGNDRILNRNHAAGKDALRPVLQFCICLRVLLHLAGNDPL